MHALNDGARDGSHGHGQHFLERVLNNFDLSLNSQNDEKLAYYAFSLANACAVARSTRRNFCLQAMDVQQFIWCQIARSTTVVPPLLFDFRKRRRAKRKASHSGSNISRSISFFILETTTREYWTVAAQQLNQKLKPSHPAPAEPAAPH